MPSGANRSRYASGVSLSTLDSKNVWLKSVQICSTNVPPDLNQSSNRRVSNPPVEIQCLPMRLPLLLDCQLEIASADGRGSSRDS